jgi:hypothetical protein
MRTTIWREKMSGCEEYTPVEFVRVKNMLFYPARQASLPRVGFLSDEMTTTDDN